MKRSTLEFQISSTRIWIKRTEIKEEKGSFTLTNISMLSFTSCLVKHQGTQSQYFVLRRVSRAIGYDPKKWPTPLYILGFVIGLESRLCLCICLSVCQLNHTAMWNSLCVGAHWRSVGLRMSWQSIKMIK